MKKATVDNELLWRYLVKCGWNYTKDEFWKLPLSRVNDICSMTEFSQSAIDKIWRKERTPFEVF